MMEWKDQYRHPNWQKKRLEALETAEFTCQRCFDTEAQLHVHHKRYVKGRTVWEYDLAELAVLCDSCHDIAHAEKDMLWRLLIQVDQGGDMGFLPFLGAYLRHKTGPCCIRDDDVVSELQALDPYGFELGKLAAALETRRVPIGSIVQLADDIENVTGGESVSMVIPKPKFIGEDC